MIFDGPSWDRALWAVLAPSQIPVSIKFSDVPEKRVPGQEASPRLIADAACHPHSHEPACQDSESDRLLQERVLAFSSVEPSIGMLKSSYGISGGSQLKNVTRTTDATRLGRYVRSTMLTAVGKIDP